MEALTVRFLENEYYDIEQDVDVVKMMAITPTGTWSAQTPLDKKTQGRRKEFREYVLEKIYEGELPCEVEFD